MDLKKRYFCLLCALVLLAITTMIYITASNRSFSEELLAHARNPHSKRAVKWLDPNNLTKRDETMFSQMTPDPPTVSSTTVKISNPFQCYNNFEHVPTLTDILTVNVTKGKNIFFLETSCKSREAGKIVLNARQACAVESAAVYNPNFDIYLLFASPATILNTSLQSDKYISSLLSYKNVHLHHVNINTYFAGTPVETLINSGNISTSEWPLIHLSDVMRFVTIWRFGAIYMDLDIIVLKSFEDFEPNFSAFEDPNYIASGLMRFSHEGKGKQWIEDIMKDINVNYRPHEWRYNSNGAIERFIYKLCSTKVTSAMTKENCQGFKLFPPVFFYPLKYSDWNQYFDQKYQNSTLALLKDSMAIHVWNKLSAHQPIRPGSLTSAYEVVASQHCLKVYSSLENEF